MASAGAWAGVAVLFAIGLLSSLYINVLSVFPLSSSYSIATHLYGVDLPYSQQYKTGIEQLKGVLYPQDSSGSSTTPSSESTSNGPYKDSELTDNTFPLAGKVYKVPKAYQPLLDEIKALKLGSLPSLQGKLRTATDNKLTAEVTRLREALRVEGDKIELKTKELRSAMEADVASGKLMPASRPGFSAMKFSEVYTPKQ